MPADIIQYRGTLGIFNHRMFVKESNIIKLSLNLHNNFCYDSALVLCNNGLFCLLFLSVLLLLKHFVSKITKYRGVLIFLFTLIHSWVGNMAPLWYLAMEMWMLTLGQKSTSYQFKFTSYDFKSTSYEFKSTNYQIKSTNYEFKSMSCNFRYTSYEFKNNLINGNSSKKP